MESVEARPSTLPPSWLLLMQLLAVLLVSRGWR